VKKRFFIGFLFLSQIIWAQSQLLSLLENEKKAFTAKTGLSSCAASANYNVTYYRCYWKIDPAVSAISGSVAMYFKALGNLDSLQMDISISMTIDSVMFHGAKINFLQQTGDVLGIKFPASIPVTATDSLTVYYHGFPAARGLGSFRNGTHRTARTPVVWTLSEPYGAKDWWPCKQTLDDKADSIDIYVEVPPSNKAASNGLLKQVYVQGANTVYHWKHKYPIATYLVCTAVTNYTEFTDTANLQSGNVPVLYYTYPEDSAMARQTDAQLLTVMHYFDSLFIPYPFKAEKYGHAQFGWGGGMEHQTMTFVGGYIIELLAHELSHHWFGDHVTCGAWTEIWLNEGFATWFTGISMGKIFGDPA